MASEDNSELQQTVQTITLTGEDGTTQVYAMDDTSQIVAGLPHVQDDSGQEVLVENDGNVFYLIQSETDALQGVSYVVIDENGKPTEHTEAIDLAAITSEQAAIDYSGVVQVELPQSEIDLENQLENTNENNNIVVIETANSNTTLDKDLTTLNVADHNKSAEHNEVTQDKTNTVEETEEETEEDNVKYLLCCHCCGEALETVDELKSHLLEYHGVSDDFDDPELADEEIEVKPTVLIASAQDTDTQDEDASGQVSVLKLNDYITERKSLSNANGEIGIHKCQFCVKSFEVRSDLDLHMEVDHEVLDDLLDLDNDDKYYCRCPYCPRLYLSKWASKSLKRHIRVDHPNFLDDFNAYEMLKVDDKSQLRKLKSDTNMYHVQRFPCPLCTKVFQWQKSLIRHTKMFHAAQIKELNDDQKRSIFGSGRKRKSLETACEEGFVEVYPCPYCSKKFLWQKSVKKHVTDNHPLLRNDFGENENMDIVESLNILNDDENENSCFNSAEHRKLKYYKCPYCNLVSKYTHSMRKHIERLHSENLLDKDVKEIKLPMVDADSGNYTVKTADSHTKEMRISGNPIVFSCPLCSYITDNKSNLQRHLTSRVHDHAYKMEDLQGNMAKFLVKQNRAASTTSKIITGTQVEKSVDSARSEVRDTEIATSEVADTGIIPEPDNVEQDAAIEIPDSAPRTMQTTETNSLDCKFADIPEMCKVHVNLKVTFNCAKCLQTFFRFEKLAEHHRKYHQPEFDATKDERMVVEIVKKDIPNLKALECPYCDLIVSQFPVLEQHISLNHLSCVNQLNIKQEPVDIDNEKDGMPKVDSNKVLSADGHLEPSCDQTTMFKADGTVDEPVIRSSSVVTGYRCMLCVCEFSEVLDLVKHMSIVHPGGDKSAKKAPKKRGRKRKTLETMSNSTTPVVTRPSTSGPEYDNKCPHCAFSCKRSSALTFHINFNHANIKQEPIDEDETPRKKAKQVHVTDKVHEIDDTVEKAAAETHNNTVATKPSERKRGRPRKYFPDKKGESEIDSIDNDKMESEIKTNTQSDSNNIADNIETDCNVIEDRSKEKDSYKKIRSEDTVLKKESIINITPVRAKKNRKRKMRRKSHAVRIEHDDINEEGDENDDAEKEVMELGLDDDIDIDYKPAEDVFIMKPEPQGKRHKCPYCESGFLSLRFLEKHVKRTHPDEFNSFSLDDVKLRESTSDLNITSDKMSNQNKKVVTANVSHWQLQPFGTESTNTFKCTYCKKSFPSQKSVHFHMNKCHKDIQQEHEEGVNEEHEELKKADDKEQVSADPNKNKNHKKVKFEFETFSSLPVQKIPEVAESSGPRLNETCYKCCYCNVFRESKGSVIRHAAYVHPREPKIDPDDIVAIHNDTDASLENSYLCPYCDKTSTWKKCIVRHVKNIHPEVSDFNPENIQIDIGVSKEVTKLPDIGQFKCPYCNAIYKWKKTVLKHIRTMHPNQNCDIDLLAVCMDLDKETSTTQSQSASDDLNLKVGKRVVRCSKCDFTSGMIKKVEKHYEACHPEDSNTTDVKYNYIYGYNNNDADGEVHKCVLCGTMYKWKKSLLYHIKTHHKDMYEVYETLNGMVEVLDRSLVTKMAKKDGVKGHTCLLCGATFKTLSAKTIHVRMKHKSRYSKYKISSRLVCGVCKMSFSSRLALTKHRAVHHLRHKSAECGLCDRKCSSQKSLALHEQICQRMKKQVCPEINCNFSCILRSSMKAHQKVCRQKQAKLSNSGALQPTDKCELCGSRFPGAIGLRAHIMQTHFSNTWYLNGIVRKKRQYACRACDKKFNLPSTRDQHFSLKHKDENNICELCGNFFPNLLQLQRHYAKHNHPVDVIQQDSCNICGLHMLKSNLFKHYLSKHPESCVCECDICVNQEIDGQRGKACDICGQIFCRKMILYAHKKIKHDIYKGDKYKCKYCEKMFRTNKQRFVHIHKTHGKGSEQRAARTTLDVTQTITTRESQDEDGKDNASTHVIHIGEGLGVQYLPRLSESSLSAVIKELMIVSSDKLSKLPYKCLLCGRSFAKTKYIRLHIRRNHVKNEDQPYRCKICGSGFVRLTEFRKHSRAHSGFRPYKCKLCSSAFKQQSNLTDHMNLHKGSKQFECFICKRQFWQRGSLNAHINQHDTLKPFKCLYCEKGFTTRGELSRHMQKYDLEQDRGNNHSFMCHVCSDSFTHFPLLQKHIDEHHPEKPFHCNVCDTSFAAYTSLYTHKVRSEHFLQSELDNSGGTRKVRRQRKIPPDIQNAVDTLQENLDSDSIQNRFDFGQMSKGRHNVPLTSDQNGTSTVCFIGDQDEVAETVYITQDGDILETQGEDGKRLEVVIEQFPTDGIVSDTQINNENEELLSIAKQLTELSTYTEAEANEAGNTTMIQEEDEIMKDMLDADQELLDNLGKQLGGRRDDGTDSWTGETTNVEIIQQVSQSKTSNIQSSQGDNLAVNINQQEVENAVAEVSDKQTVVKLSPSKTMPTNMEELASLIAENPQMALEGESVTAYQTEDGSIIYVCMEQPDTMEGESYDVTTTDEYTEMEAGNVAIDGKAQYENVEQGIEKIVVKEEMGLTIYESGLVIKEDGTVKQEIDTIGDDDRPVIQDNETVIYEKETVAPVGHTVIYDYDIHPDSEQNQYDVHQTPINVGRTSNQHGLLSERENNTVLQACTIMKEEDENTIDNIESVETTKQSETFVTHIAIETKAGSSYIGQTGVNEMTQADETMLDNDEYVNSQQKVVEYLHDEQTFIKEELIDKDYKKIMDKSNRIDEFPVLRYQISDNEFQCLKCSYTCRNHKNMKKHLKRHTPFRNREFECTVCDKKFVTSTELIRHNYIHTGEKNFECKYCSKLFRQAGHLRDHIKAHLGQKDYKCKDCDMAFTTRTQCSAHWQRIHNKEKPFCDICGKTFSDKLNIIKHKGSVHSGALRKESKRKVTSEPCEFTCHICGAGYMKKAAFQSHVHRHKAEEKQATLICEVCGDTFKAKSFLRDHMILNHSDDKPEICEYCGSRFKIKKQLNFHIRMKHKQPKPKKTYFCGCGKQFSTRNSLYYHLGKSETCKAGETTVIDRVTEVGDKATEAKLAVTNLTETIL